MSAGILNIIVEKGATFSRQITVKDASDVAVNLTGCQVRAKMRPSYESTDATAFTMSITNASGGIVSWVISAETTAALDTGVSANWVYDVEIEFGDGVVERILQGVAVVSPEATR